MSAPPTPPLRLIALGIGAAAIGFAIGGLARGGSPDPGTPPGSSLDAEAMQTAMSEALREPRTLERIHALDALLDQLDADNVTGAERAVDPVAIGIDDCDAEAYLDARAVFDPRGAFDEFLRWPGTHKRSLGARTVSFSWAYHGAPLEVRSAIQSLENKSVRDAAFMGLISGWAKSDDLEGATRFLSLLPPSTQRDDLLLSLLTSAQLERDGIESLFAWTERIPVDAPNRFKQAAFQSAVLQASYVDPARTLEFWKLHADEAWADDSLWRLAVGWERSDPAAALDWLLALEPRSGRNDAISRVMRRWFSREPRAAKQWLARTDLSAEPALARALRDITQQMGKPLPWDAS